jgi:glutamine amidotransferase
MKVALVDYGSGNLHSAAKAFERAARESEIAAEIVVTSDPTEVGAADRIVLPGVGAFADCRRGLDAVEGMVETMQDAVHRRGRPFLGICVGMQLMASRGLEKETTRGLDWIGGDVCAIRPASTALKIPHMGWNTLHPQKDHPLTRDIALGPNGLHAYFVHSYALLPDDPDDLVAVADYGGPVTAIVARGNMAGTQFHPEKSQTLGLAFLANFLRWQP